MAEPRLDAAVVVNAARLHEETASRLLTASVPVLVEKPMALRRGDAEVLFAQAQARGVPLAPALTYLQCSYLGALAAALHEGGAPASRVRLEWSDPRFETRHGEEKNYDPGISIAQDVMPHVWSILTMVLGQPSLPTIVRGCRMSRGGRRAEFDLSFSGVACDIVLEREAPARRRHLSIDFANARRASLDFTSEPGELVVGQTRQCADPEWNRRPRPVQRTVAAFLDLVASRSSPEPWRRIGVASVALAEEADHHLKATQRAWLDARAAATPDEDAAYALGELAAPRLYADGSLRPGDRAAWRQRVDAIMEQAAGQTPGGRSVIEPT